MRLCPSLRPFYIVFKSGSYHSYHQTQQHFVQDLLKIPLKMFDMYKSAILLHWFIWNVKINMWFPKSRSTKCYKIRKVFFCVTDKLDNEFLGFKHWKWNFFLGLKTTFFVLQTNQRFVLFTNIRGFRSQMIVSFAVTKLI